VPFLLRRLQPLLVPHGRWRGERKLRPSAGAVSDRLIVVVPARSGAGASVLLAPMRTPLIAFVLALGLAAPASAQFLRVRLNDTTAEIPVFVSLKTSPGPSTFGGLVVAAKRVKPGAAAPTVPEFRLRAWNEGDSLRVVVFTVPTNRKGEKQIASQLLSWDQPPVEIHATTNYGAQPLTVRADSTPPRPWQFGPDLVRSLDLVRPPGIFLGER
jgi:hypothetical protein